MAIWVNLNWDNDSVKCESQTIQVSTNQQDWSGIPASLFRSGSSPTNNDRSATINQTETQTRTLYYRVGANYAGNTKWSDPIAVEVTGTDDVLKAPTNVTGDVSVE